MTPRRFGAVGVLFFLPLLGVSTAEATPLTWVYQGAVISTFSPALVPVGASATIALTVNPAANLWNGFSGCGDHPEGGAYGFTEAITFGGFTFHAQGFFEVNYDFYGCFPQPGVRQVQYAGYNSGPSLSGGVPFPTSYIPSGWVYNNGQPCFASAGASRCQDFVFGTYLGSLLSGEFGGFSAYGFTMGFAGADCLGSTCMPVGSITVFGTAVPEPSTIALVSAAIAIVGVRRRRAAFASARP